MQAVDRDETISWRVAAIVMAVVTLFTVVTRLLGTDPFTTIFDLFIVYVTTAVLVGTLVVQRIRRRARPTAYTMSDQRASENTAA